LKDLLVVIIYIEREYVELLQPEELERVYVEKKEGKERELMRETMSLECFKLKFNLNRLFNLQADI